MKVIDLLCPFAKGGKVGVCGGGGGGEAGNVRELVGLLNQSLPRATPPLRMLGRHKQREVKSSNHINLGLQEGRLRDIGEN